MESEAIEAGVQSAPHKIRSNTSKRRTNRRSGKLTGNARFLTTLAAVMAVGPGLALLIWGALISADSFKLLIVGKKAEGGVTRVDIVQTEVIRKYKDSFGREATRREKVHMPVSTIDFRAEYERLYSFTAGSVAEVGAIEHRVGHRIEVIYDPSNPQDARIDNGWAMWQSSLVMFGFGLASMIVGVTLVREVRHMRPSGAVNVYDIQVSRLGRVLDVLVVVAWNVVALGTAYLWLTQSRLSETWQYVACIAPAVLVGALLLVGAARTFRTRTA